MVGVLIRMKLAVLRHSMTGQRAADMIGGGVLGLVLAGGTIWLALRDWPVDGLPLDLVGRGVRHLDDRLALRSGAVRRR